MLERKELNDLASAFKLPIKGATKQSLTEALLKSAKEPTLMSFFGSAKKTAAVSRLRSL